MLFQKLNALEHLAMLSPGEDTVGFLSESTVVRRGKMDIIATVFIVVNEMVGWHH